MPIASVGAHTKPKSTSRTKQPTKQDRIITLLKRPKGATLGELCKASNWQEHSIRGFMSGMLKKRLKLNVSSNKDAKGVRRYRIDEKGSSDAATSASASKIVAEDAG